jgi:zinc protease
MRRWCILLPLMAAAAGQEVTTATLENGMKVLVQEDHNIPNVAMYLFYKVGSRNERPGTTGISHFFEHMMFNGAKKYGPKQFDIQMDNAGGSNNAYTTRDLTVYTNWFPRTALELMFDMEADRIRDLAFDPKIIESERGVVYSERRNGDNNNSSVLGEQLNAAAFIAHPYQWPVVGWASDIESWTLDDLKQHFRMAYAPNNCILVVVGDTTSAEILGLAKKFLEPIPSQAPPPPVRTKEPDQRGERRVIVRKLAQLPIQFVAWHVPETKHPDTTALDVLQRLLSEGQSSRLYRRLVDTDQLAVSVSAGFGTTLDPALFRVTIQPRTGVDTARTEAVLYEEIERVRTQPVSDAELAKAKNQIIAGMYRQMKTIAGRANLLGTFEIFYGDHRRLYSIDKEVAAVTAGDVQRVARKYLTADNRTVATLIPETVSTQSKQAGQ